MPESSERSIEGLPPRRADVEIFPELERAWPADGFGSIVALAAQLPDPQELAAGSLLIVHETGRRPRGFRRLLALWRRKRRAHVAVRCSALLARGYLDIGAAHDPRSGERLAWGFAPETSSIAASRRSS